MNPDRSKMSESSTREPATPERKPSSMRPNGLSRWVSEDGERIQDLAAIVGMLPDVIFKCEKRADGKIYWLLNEGMLAEQFGVTTDKVLGKTLEDMFPPDAAARLLPHFERCFAGEAHEFINELHGRHFKHFPQPLFDAQGKVEAVVGFITDVTNLVKAEEEIRNLNQLLEARVHDLESANRQLEAFSYSVSHDLRNPLGVINTSAHLLVRAIPNPDPKVKGNLERLQRSAKRMDLLIDDILSMAKATRGELRRDAVDLSAQAEDVVAELRLQHPDREVSVHIDRNLAATGDSRLLRVVVENLFSNAWKYTQRTADAKIEFLRDPSKGESTFLIRDNGAGFDMSQANKLFHAFERLHDDAEFEGNGVGLATVRRIVVSHGGDIWVESAPGKGATFHFSLQSESSGT